VLSSQDMYVAMITHIKFWNKWHWFFLHHGQI